MSSYTASTLVEAAETYFTSAWTFTPIAYENMSFDSPIDDPWVRISVQFYQSDQAGLGSSCVYLRGQITVQIFTRYDTGTGPALELVDHAISILQNQDLGGILTYAANITKIGDAQRQMNRLEVTWYQTNVSVNFETT